MSASDRNRWDDKYADKDIPDRLSPDAWLIEQVAGLPPGRALELACGQGHNAIWLAQQGWQVTAVDISQVGLSHARQFATAQGVAIDCIAADVEEYVAPHGVYDLVVVFRFLDRTCLPRLVESALRPGGRMVYETFTMTHVSRPGSHMRNPVFALGAGELPRLYSALDVLTYAECSLPDRDVARLVAIKPVTGSRAV